SESSIRDIPIGKKFCKILRAEKLRQAARRLEYGKYYKGSNLVCSWPDGSMMVPSDFRYFGQYCKKTFGSGSFHSLRHTHATMLLESGLDLELVSKRLGHSSIVTTARTYSHVLDKRKEKTRLFLDTAL
ncbi:MAG: tyrosine-type recombinase/integrase, partial [Selenomonadaceae bacterium]|nr:tyrosine-type recombinase/integrase [Selenomonadaceae bacterium]